METLGEHAARAQPPQCIVLKRARDLDGRQNDIWVRRVLLGLVLLIPLAAVLNAFGQRPQTSITAGEAASLKVYAPARVRRCSPRISLSASVSRVVCSTATRTSSFRTAA